MSPKLLETTPNIKMFQSGHLQKNVRCRNNKLFDIIASSVSEHVE